MANGNGNGGGQQVDPVAVNLATRRYLLSTAQPMLQPLATATKSAAQIAAGDNVISLVPRNVGLLRGFWVRVTGSLTEGATQTANRTGRGVYNALRNIQYWDLQNNQRVNTSGFHCAFVNTAKLGWVFGGAYAPNVPAGYGNNWVVNDLPATLNNATATFSVFYYIPIAYSHDDTTGAIFTGMTGGTQRLVLTVNPTPGYTTGDSLYAMMGGGTSAIAYTGGSDVIVEVWQDYWDQLRRDPNGNPILPQIDLGTSYLLTDTALSGLVLNQEYPIEFANYRKFLSTFVVYDNFSGSNGEAAFGNGNLSRLKLTTANYTNIDDVTPQLQALRSRVQIGTDWPLGVYYHDWRRKPIDTINYGSQQLTYTPSGTLNAQAYLYVGWEAFADTAIVTQAGSLPGGG